MGANGGFPRHREAGSGGVSCATVPGVHLQPLAIAGVFRATPATKAARQFDWYRADALAPALPPGWTPAIGTTYTRLRGQVEGLHCDRGHRVLTCPAGRIALVVVDLRRGEATFGRWIPIDLDTVNRVSVVVPPHAAWGFQAHTDTAAMIALHAGSTADLTIDPADPGLQITWPLPVTGTGGLTLIEASKVLGPSGVVQG
jgi:dTDP-4-dehydrorhamnose 3,5-epimerase-like enzyme